MAHRLRSKDSALSDDFLDESGSRAYIFAPVRRFSVDRFNPVLKKLGENQLIRSASLLAWPLRFPAETNKARREHEQAYKRS